VKIEVEAMLLNSGYRGAIALYGSRIWTKWYCSSIHYL